MRPFFRILLCSALLLITQGIAAQTGNYVFNHVYAREGLYASDVYSIIQDRRGFIWLGTGNGLYRYDGYEFRGFRKDPDDSTSISATVIGFGNSLLEDRYGMLWIGTPANGLNLFDPVREKFTRFNWEPDNPEGLSCPAITGIYEDRSGTIWLGSIWGLIRYNRDKNNFTTFRVFEDDPNSFLNYTGLICEDNAGHLIISMGDRHYFLEEETGGLTEVTWPGVMNEELKNRTLFQLLPEGPGTTWYATDSGLYRHDVSKDEMRHYLFELDSPLYYANRVYQVVTDPFDNNRYLWIRAGEKIYRFDKGTWSAIGFQHDPTNPNSLGYTYMHDIYLDRTGLLWIAKESGGIDILPAHSNQFDYHSLDPVPPDTEPYSALSFLKDADGELWMGAHRAGLLHFDSEMNFIELFREDPDDPCGLLTYFVFCLFEDNKDTLWVGSTNGGGLYLFDKNNKCFTHCIFYRPDSIDVSFEYIAQFYKDSQGIRWACQNYGLYYLDEFVNNVPHFKVVPHFELGNAITRCIIEDGDGNLWIGTQGAGLFRLDPENREDTVFTGYYEDPGNPNTISDNSIMSFYIDKDSVLWIGTMHGLNKYLPDEDRFVYYDSQNGLEADKIFYVTGDEQGNLWLSTGSGLVRFNPHEKPGRMSKRYDKRDGVPFEEIYPYKIYKDSDGLIYVGGRRGTGMGYYRFHPDSLRDNLNVPPVVLTDFKVRNKPYNLDTSIILKKNLVLGHGDNFFSIEFAALDYTNPSKNNYAYRLEGFDDEWIYAGTKRNVDYTNVPPGHYLFRVKGSNNDGIWNEEGVAVAVTILPPPWKTWWAYSLYGLFVVGVVLSIAWYYLKRQQLKHQLALEQVEKEKLAELDSLKSRFFANISHEFRTPLTLILGPIEKLKERTSGPEAVRDLEIMQRNARRLQRLINQLLSLSRLESGRMELKARPENIVSLCRIYMQSFESLARQKDIRFSFEASEEEILAYVDQEKIEHILNNLLSNAFKFTPEGGEIRLLVGRKQDLVVLTVSDTGAGIPRDKIDKVFDRFFQADDSTIRRQEGTGIGLAMVHELVKLHHGEISVESEEGKGTVFTVRLPLGSTHLREDEIAGAMQPATGTVYPDPMEREIVAEDLAPSDMAKVPNISNHKSTNGNPIVLIVEDNADLRQYIRSHLDDNFNVAEANDGKDGLDKALDIIPDLVISDVMMPGMDGMELCRRLKTDEKTSHIPVIILTALASVESKLEGLETGADDFLTKPFDHIELKVRVSNLITQRQKLREKHWREFGMISRTPAAGALSLDQQFLLKAREVMDGNIHDPDFSVEKFSREMGMSRVQLHRKLTGLIGQSASSFMRNIRLMKATELLKAKSGNVSQVAYEVGFNNLSWFAKCFQQQYGVSPSEYYRSK